MMESKPTIKDLIPPLSVNLEDVQCIKFRGINLIKDDVKFDFDVFLPTYGCNLQRELCWTDEQKSNFIKSIIARLKIPPFSLLKCVPHEDKADWSNHWYQVIDGKQRLTTYLGFLRGEVKIECGGEWYTIDEISDEARNRVEGWGIHAIITFDDFMTQVSDDQKIEWYRFVNFLGTPQEEDHLENILKRKK
jgi:hypothetical protein